MQQIADVERKLLPQRQVETELRAHGSDRLFRGAVAHHQAHRIAGRELHQQEADQGDPEQHRDQMQHPIEDRLRARHSG